MISYLGYKLIHLLGVIALFLALGGLTFHAVSGGTRSGASRKLVAITHGVALFLVILGGFGLLARIGVTHGTSWPGWVWTKLAIWLLLGAALALPYRKPELAKPLWFILPLLGGVAAYMALYKPF